MYNLNFVICILVGSFTTEGIANKQVLNTNVMQESAGDMALVQKQNGQRVSTYEPLECMSLKPDAAAIVTKVTRNSENDLRRIFSLQHFQFEAVRLATFWDWTSDIVTAKELSKNGFFSLHKGDLVQCHYCRGVIGFWEKGDSPSIEHAKHYPTCSFVRGTNVTNIPLDNSETSKLMHKVIRDTLDAKDLPVRKSSFCTDSKQVACPQVQSIPQYPTFKDVKKREETFVDISSNLPPKKEMAEAGFFLLGLSDMSQCWFCAGGVFNWRSHEDPSAVHDELYPTCALSKERRGSSSPPADVGKKRIRPDDKTEEMKVLDLPLAKKLMKAGWEPEVIAGALWSELERFGFLPCDVNEATDVVADYEEFLENN